ncbi:unnamed protein product [Oikopleura dioica]|uniref:Uncharacterized protein n=1 Tax=Oikopleura dioica TaxID=34765 RepID=E4X8L7_OIKDI|nr:unnamed protein product [Oikopleura dioica]CBY30411.1 unnamed protein product [Oikopleura dioica]
MTTTSLNNQFNSLSTISSSASNPFGSSVTNSTTTQNSPAASSNSNPFQSAPSNPFGSSQASTVSSSPSLNSAPSNPFGNGSGTTKTSSQTSVFGSAIAVDESKLSKMQADDVVYSKIDELSATEKEAYKSAAFTFENLPISPPSKELCF